LSTNFENIKNLPLKFGINLILHLNNKNNEQKAWEMWLVKYPHMSKDDFVTFAEFLESLKPKQISIKSREEILENARQIRARACRNVEN
jgi:wyosine [tRNA(Phe)-imidazoG37] synthetase (radical SAM superfamily)